MNQMMSEPKLLDVGAVAKNFRCLWSLKFEYWLHSPG